MSRDLNMVYSGETPWAHSGAEVKAGTSPKDMLKAAGLDWKVSKTPLFHLAQDPDGAEGHYLEVPGKYALVRETDDKVLSVTGAGYKPLQNSDAVDFFTKFVDAGDMEMRAIGSVKDGSYIWALAEVGSPYRIGPAKSGDEIGNYVLLTAPHIAGQSMRAQFVATRRSCWNTISLALSSGGRTGHAAGRLFRMPHSQVFDNTLKNKAAEALGFAIERGKTVKDQFNLLASKPLAGGKVTKFFYELLRIKDEAVQEILDGKKSKPLMLEKFEDALEKAPGSQLITAKGTLFGALNAVTYVVDHEQGRTRDNGLYGAWYGEGAALKQRALGLALAKAGA